MLSSVSPAEPGSNSRRSKPVARSRLSIARAGGVVLAGVVLAAALWRLLGWILLADRGLDLTDEGLYLLAAEARSLDSYWGVPFGWHTAPLYRWVGYDVAAFRTAGAFLLVGAAAALGAAAASVGRALREAGEGGRPGKAGARQLLIEIVLGALLGGLGGLLYYGGLVRTPSYNWVTVFGATVAAVGLLIVMQSVVPSASSSGRSSLWGDGGGPARFPLLGGVLLAGFGLFFTVPAKPTTPIFFVLLGAPALFRLGGARFVVRVMGAVAATAMAFVLIAVIAGFWSESVVSIFVRALDAPSLLESQSVRGAVLSLPRFPLVLASRPGVLPIPLAIATFLVLRGRVGERFGPGTRDRTATAVLGISGVVLLVWAVAIPISIRTVESPPIEEWTRFVLRNASTAPVSDSFAAVDGVFLELVVPFLGIVGGLALALLRESGRRRIVGLLLASTGLVVHSELVNSLRTGTRVSTQVVRAEVTVAATLVVAGIVLIVVASGRDGEGSLGRRSGASTAVPHAVGFLFLFGVLTGFGSGHGLLHQASLASGLLVAASVLAATAQQRQDVRRSALLLITLFVGLASTTQFIGNRDAPYRITSMQEQTVGTKVGPHGNRILLDRETSDLLDGLSSAAALAGWQSGTPLLAVAFRWSSTIPWHLGARTPDSLMLTLGGYGDGSEALFELNLESLDVSEFEKAWVLVSGASHPGRETSVIWAERAARHVGSAFPDDYLRVFAVDLGHQNEWLRSSGDVELWRPKRP